ncbi:anhydro-N-acetylmuramic acid kinase [Paenimyroides tangerinum]|uniref:Anhydro-N-acetylmuramic acid kinase n=1 Tax=Paenimyroides tangerinum TaxID=2488728 RepID=A0A3P3W8E6_9FLAO|nr:anhydro-N-acetylmuramic acid kinase [Paenimyroides tangerinum]RRJ91260.1 anhydro-N-acetylmuramic acid kinase [Paenimyroides tangerinum]
MNFEKNKILGIMSGTSLDGIDFAVVDFQLINGKWKFQINETQTYSYSKEWFEKLKFAAKLSKIQLENLNKEYTFYLNQQIKRFIDEFKITNLDAIASHGHTILHNPKEGYTLQIGNLPDLKNGFDIPIVCNFRVQDVKFGGQGAPLVPIGDRLLFSEFDFCLNLGGFSNISYEIEGVRIAYDISPVNTVLNFYANQIGLEYDENGDIASKGNIHFDLLGILNANDFYQKSFPKSLGIEFVFNEVLPIINRFNIEIQDVLATYVEHIAIQIENVLKNKTGKMLVTGGGAFNTFLIERIKKRNPNIQIIIPNPVIMNYKEALIFAFLGILKLNNTNNVLASVTGAKMDHSSGVIL